MCEEVAAEQGELGFPQAETLGEDFDQGFVGLPFSAIWVTETLSIPSCKPRISLRSARLGPQREQDTFGVQLQVDHGSTPSNSAEPTRTMVAPSSIAAS